MLPSREDLFIERTASPGSSNQWDRQTNRSQNSLNLFQVPIAFIFFKLKVMVTSCGVVGCAKWIVNTDETSQKLSEQRRDTWLSRINRKDLTPSQLEEKNSTLRVFGSHFILGRTAALFEPSNPDWAPSLNLEYKNYQLLHSTMAFGEAPIYE